MAARASHSSATGGLTPGHRLPAGDLQLRPDTQLTAAPARVKFEDPIRLFGWMIDIPQRFGGGIGQAIDRRPRAMPNPSSATLRNQRVAGRARAITSRADATLPQ